MAASATLPPFRDIQRKIRNAGLPSALIRKAILPSWWNKEDESSPALCQSAYLEIAAKLGVAYAELLNTATPLCLEGSVRRVAFKTGNKNKTARQLSASAHIAFMLAKIVATAYANSRDYVAFKPHSASECRQSILTGSSWVSFKPLLAFCWRSGIPVVFWKGVDGQAFDGIATSIDGVPVIVLGTMKNTAWSTFHLAHELGHVMLGHTEQGLLNLDQQISESNADSNKTESAANEFAATLLHGDNTFPDVDVAISPSELEKLAVRFQVSPATLLLGSCLKSPQTADFSRLNIRLGKLKEVTDTRQTINELLMTKIGHDFEKELADWQHDFLEALIG